MSNNTDNSKPFLLGHASNDVWPGLVETCLQSIGQIPAGYTLGFIYTTDSLANDLAAIRQMLAERTGIQHWSGTTGLGVCTTAREYYDAPALVVMLTNIDEAHFRVFNSQGDTAGSIIEQHQHWYDNGETYLGILHGNPTNPATPSLIEQLAEQVPGAFFVGGLSSSNSIHPLIRDSETLTSGGISGVLFSESVRVTVRHTQGCTPISQKHIITKCQKNLVIELDNRPALDVFLEDIGEILAQDLNRIGGYIFAGLPVPHSDTGDYLVRNLVGIDTNEKVVAIAEHVDEGDRLMFCQRDGNTALDDMHRMLDDISKDIKTNPKGALYFSCLARGRNQFGDNSEELTLIKEKLGDIPLAGFFANGEIFHNRLYGYTGVLTVFL